VGALAYADDLTLLAPSPAALRRLLHICKQFGAANMLRFNPVKTQCITFSRTSCTEGSCSFVFCGKSILCAKSVVHLGHGLTCNLMDNADILRCSRDFCKQANGILFRFGFCDPIVQTRLLLNYCMSLYGCALWSLNCNEIKHLDVCLNKCLRRIWSLPANSHTGIVHCVSGCVSVYNVCFQRFCKLYQSACSSNNFLVRTVFRSASLSCRNFVGHNFMFGKSFVRDYSGIPLDTVNLVRELRDNSLFVPGFLTSELNVFVHNVTTS